MFVLLFFLLFGLVVFVDQVAKPELPDQ